MSSSLTKGFEGTINPTGTISTSLDGYLIHPLPVLLASPHKIAVDLDGYNVNFVPVKVVSPNKLQTSIDGYSTGPLPVFAPSLVPIIDTGNSTTTPLGAGGVWNGSTKDVLLYETITVNLIVDQDSAANGLVISFSPDATNWDRVYSYDITRNLPIGGLVYEFVFSRERRYLKVSLTNGAIAQGFMRLQTILDPQRKSNEPVGLLQTGYAPDPNSRMTVMRRQLQLDPHGNLATRSQITGSEGDFNDDFPGINLLTTLTGTMSFVNGSRVVIGTGTLFTSEVNMDNYVVSSVHSESAWTKVQEVIDDTHITLISGYPGATIAGVAGCKTYWKTYSGGGSPSVVNSICRMSQAITNGVQTAVWRLNNGPNVPQLGLLDGYLDARRADQNLKIGFADSLTAPTKLVCFMFDGIVNTVVKCLSWSSNATADQLSTTVTLPDGITSASTQTWGIRFFSDKAIFLVNDKVVATHRTHLPIPTNMNFGWCISNTAGTAGVTNVYMNGAILALTNRIDVTVSQPVSDALKATTTAVFQPPSTLIAAGDMSGNLSAIYPLYSQKYVSVHLAATATSHVGTFTFACSHTGLAADAVTLLLTSSITASAGTALNALAELQVFGAYLHIIYTFGSGIGTLVCTACTKE